MQLQWRPKAKGDLQQLIAYVNERNPAAALRTLQTIRDRVGLLSDQPGLGRPGRVAGTRELVIVSTPYIVAYTVDRGRNTVFLLRVLHGAQKWPEAFEDIV